MLLKSKLVEIRLQRSNWKTLNLYGEGIHHVNAVFNFLCSSFCSRTETPKTEGSPNMTESPELPGWVKFYEKENQLVENPEEEDFMLPTLSYWTDNRKHRDQTTDIKCLVSNIIDSEVDRVCKILRNRFQSPDAVMQALNGCSVNVSESLVDQMLKRFSNDWIQAFGFFSWAKTQMSFKNSADLYNLMVDILGKCRRFDLMWELIGEMDQLEGYITLITMTKVLRRLAKACRYVDAIDAFRRIDQFGVSKDAGALNALMDALVKENSVEHAEDVYLEFQNYIPPTSHTFNILIHGWCKARQVEKAKKIMGEMEKQGYLPDVISYTCFIEAYCREKDFRKVDAVLQEMQERGCPPNAVTYTIVMHALGKAKEMSKALEVFDKMKQSDCVPDSSFYSSLIYILSKSGRLKDACEVFEDMSKQGVCPDLLTYNTMITNACDHSHEENALKLLQEMEKNCCKPDLRTYAPLLKMCCRNKRMKVLFFLLKHMFENDISLDLGTYSLLVHGLCKSGRLEHACSFFEQTVSRGFIPTDWTYKMLTKELEKKGMEKGQQRIEELMLQAKSNRGM